MIRFDLSRAQGARKRLDKAEDGLICDRHRCGTATPQWRDSDGQLWCEACALLRDAKHGWQQIVLVVVDEHLAADEERGGGALLAGVGFYSFEQKAGKECDRRIGLAGGVGIEDECP
jgi:hypothetical protein